MARQSHAARRTIDARDGGTTAPDEVASKADRDICRDDARHLTVITCGLRLPFRSECDRLGGAPGEHRINDADRLR
jgi:hypothetical protein